MSRQVNQSVLERILKAMAREGPPRERAMELTVLGLDQIESEVREKGKQDGAMLVIEPDIYFVQTEGGLQ